MSAERDGFGPRLKAERERRGITLQKIAASTKIGVPLLEALERNDVSRWPQGIYRRAFIRAYVGALGLPPEPLVAEFVRLFPEHTASVPAHQISAIRSVATVLQPDPPVPLAPTLAESTGPSARAALRRVLAVVIELSGIVFVGGFIAWSVGASVLTVAGLVALVYYPLMNASVGGSLALKWDRRRGSLRANPLRSGRDMMLQESVNVRVKRLRAYINASMSHRPVGRIRTDAEWPAFDRQHRHHWISSARRRTRRAIDELWINVRTLPEHLGRSAWRRVMRRKA